jgi:N-acetylglutamate synthase-like GNAT family acetyltransferase
MGALHRHLCVFANTTGDLTMLLPPIPTEGATDDDLRSALVQAFDIMDAYQQNHGTDLSRSRIEYVSDEMLERINTVLGKTLRLSASPMSGDFVYPVRNMIDLAGKALKSKRHGKTRFVRDYGEPRVETMNESHVADCLSLLDRWQDCADQVHDGQVTEDENAVATEVLRRRESIACRQAVVHREALGLRGMVVYVGDQLVAFTLGESLSPSQASILFEKTDPQYHGAPQYVFSKFCETAWADHPEINVGDDWGIPTLRWTKESYRPTRRLAKYSLSRPVDAPLVRRATRNDIDALIAIEQRCFDGEQAFKRSHLRHLLSSPHAICLVTEAEGRIVGSCIALHRRFGSRITGRIYSLAVDPAAQEQGVGSMLLDAAIRRLERRGIQRIYLEVSIHNGRGDSALRASPFRRSAPPQ